MKKRLSAREKFLLVVLIIMAIYMAYYYVFYLPTKAKIDYYKQEAVVLEEKIAISEEKIVKLGRMSKELNEIKAGDTSNLKVLPQYDNSRNVMNSLSEILSQAVQYEVNFSGEKETAGIVRRDITLNYQAASYDAAKRILKQIYEGEYRCLLKDLYITQEAENWNVNVEVTYFEYI